jgi:hypothetical protein
MEKTLQLVVVQVVRDLNEVKEVLVVKAEVGHLFLARVETAV